MDLKRSEFNGGAAQDLTVFAVENVVYITQTPSLDLENAQSG